MRTAEQDEYLNELYTQREAMETRIQQMPGDHSYEEFQGWWDLDDEITKLTDPDEYYRRVTCRICTLAPAMRNCKICRFECGLRLGDAVRVAYMETPDLLEYAEDWAADPIVDVYKEPEFGTCEWFNSIDEIPF